MHHELLLLRRRRLLPGLPGRWLPALTAGLAYYVSMKRPETAQRTQLLKAVYDEQFGYAAEEDRVKASIQLVPGGYGGVGYEQSNGWEIRARDL